MTLNEHARTLAQRFLDSPAAMRVAVSEVAGATIIDCGIAVRGGLWAGVELAKTCLAGLADVTLVPGDAGPLVQVATDDPLRACLAAQYAGWQVQAGKYFAMGSGPMRSAANTEAIIHELQTAETPNVAVGILETTKLPTVEAIDAIRAKLPATVTELVLLCAPTASIAGTVQVVARSVETALHKLHTLKFDLNTIVSAYGTAPLPAIGANTLQAIGWTNDAILYHGQVTLWVDADDAMIEAIGPQVPSSASKDHGKPFADIFAAAGNDFYKIDPLLFSPAEVTFRNLRTGKSQRYGQIG